MEGIPPMKDALKYHICRAIYQGGHCWGRTLEKAPMIEDWGWTNPREWTTLWTMLPQASKSSCELLCCGCKKGCRGRCRCVNAALKCTSLCQCYYCCTCITIIHMVNVPRLVTKKRKVIRHHVLLLSIFNQGGVV